MDMDMVDVDMVDVDMVNWKFGKFHIFGKFTKDHLADLSRLLGLVFQQILQQSLQLPPSSFLIRFILDENH